MNRPDADGNVDDIIDKNEFKGFITKELDLNRDGELDINELLSFFNAVLGEKTEKPKADEAAASEESKAEEKPKDDDAPAKTEEPAASEESKAEAPKESEPAASEETKADDKPKESDSSAPEDPIADIRALLNTMDLPVDGSDVTDLESAKAEIARFRALSAKYGPKAENFPQNFRPKGPSIMFKTLTQVSKK